MLENDFPTIDCETQLAEWRAVPAFSTEALEDFANVLQRDSRLIDQVGENQNFGGTVQRIQANEIPRTEAPVDHRGDKVSLLPIAEALIVDARNGCDAFRSDQSIIECLGAHVGLSYAGTLRFALCGSAKKPYRFAARRYRLSVAPLGSLTRASCPAGLRETGVVVFTLVVYRGSR